MADSTEFVNVRVEALNETREVHVGDVQQQLRTIQHRVPPPLDYFSLSQIVHHEITEHRFRSFHRFLSRCCAAIFTSWASFQRPIKILHAIFPLLPFFFQMGNFRVSKNVILGV